MQLLGNIMMNIIYLIVSTISRAPSCLSCNKIIQLASTFNLVIITC